MNNVNGFYNYYQPQAYANNYNNGDQRIWVQGEIGAKAYLVANGNTVALWDSESQNIYIKSVINGMPSMQKLTYSVVNAQPTNMDQYVTKEYFEQRMKEIMRVKEDEPNE